MSSIPPPLAALPAAAQAIVEAAPDAMVIADRRGRIVLVNAQAERLFGFRREELIGELVERLIPERHRASHPGYRAGYFDAPRARPMGAGGLDLFGRRKDGTEFPAEISLSPLETEEGLLAMTAIRDATDRRKAEEERIRLAQAQEAVRIRDEFMSIAAHELRTPLTALQLQLQALQQLLRKDGDPPPPDANARMRSKVEKSARQAERLTDLVNTLLDVSRVIGGRLAINPEPTDLVRLVQEVADHFREEARRVGCTLTVDCACPEVKGCWDRFRIEQVLTNLLSNAMKYGAGNPVEVRVGREGSAAVFSVRDRGIGIAAADAERIFQKFERAVSLMHYGGLGLGLYIARSLVEAHGGRIRVESAPGLGATFTVELPPEPPPAPAPAESVASGARGAP